MVPPEGSLNLIMSLKVKLMRAADQKELRSGEKRENLTQTEKLGGSFVFEEVMLIWRDSTPSLYVLISVPLLFLSRLGLKLGVQFFSRLCGCL